MNVVIHFQVPVALGRALKATLKKTKEMQVFIFAIA
jgi:hypothetical protein